jgi:hypothetical protein
MSSDGVTTATEERTTLPGREHRWTRLQCSRCAYAQERPGVPLPGDLEQPCQLCGAELGAVTVYAISPACAG